MAGRQSAAADLQRAHADVEAAKAELAAAKVRAQEAEARLRAAKAYLSEAEARGGDEAKGGDEPRPPTRRRADDAARPRIDPDAARRLEALEAELRKLREDLVGGRADKLSEELVGERAATADARGRLLMSYALKHASAKPAAEALSNLFSKAGVTVIVDERTNSLFIQGNSDRLDEIRHALAAMDAPPDGDAPADAPKNAPANGRR